MDKKKNIIQQKKKEFRDKYFDKGSAAYLGIIAATQRASLYTPNMNNADIRERWEHVLNNLVAKYKRKQQDSRTFIKDIEDLKIEMNTAFPATENRFNNGKEDYDNEFRIAHAQKSLSICLKHLWCRGELGNFIPPLCPVDGVLLKAVNNYDSWTKVNTVEEYLNHIELFNADKELKGYDTLSEWELCTWKPTKKKTTGNKTSSSQPKKDTITVLNQSKSVLGRVPLIGYMISSGNVVLYLFVGKDARKYYCEVLSKNGTYIKEDELIAKGLQKQGGKHPYYIKKFKKDEREKAESFMKEVLKIFK